MTTKTIYDRTASAALRDRYSSALIAHPHLTRAREEVMGIVRQRTGAAACLVMGPTGVGKSTLINPLIDAIAVEAAPLIAADPTRMASFRFDAPPAKSGNFSVREFFTRGLLALHDPAMVAVAGKPAGGNAWRGLGEIGALQRAFESAVRERNPLAIILDEANHMAMVGDGLRMLSQMDLIKSISDATGTLFLMVGTYDLIRLRNTSGQLGRRLQEVHFPRYSTHPSDMRKFASSVKALCLDLPIEHEAMLDDPWFMYRGSAGCVGLAKQWIERALGLAIDEQAPTLTRSHLEAKRLSPGALSKISQEINWGENQLADEAAAESNVDHLLGIPSGDGNGNNGSKRASKGTDGPPSPPSDGRKGIRSPGPRDQTGNNSGTGRAAA